MNGFNPPITPAKIVQEGWRFSIPIYQRLFVWESEQIDRLLEDLWKASTSSSPSGSSEPYYIGVITTVEQDDKKGRVFSVVDGQQRLTFLLLFFSDCLARGERVAESFVFVNTSDKDPEELDLRIKFLGRKSDEDDIRHYACGKCDEVGNYNFRQFHDRMKAFIEKHKGEWEKRKDTFVQYVYSMTSFLANELNGYSNADLNLYFEKMNSTGRQLSPLDQLKGSFAKYASRWNDCFNFEKAIKEITEKRHKENVGITGDNSKSVQIDIQGIVGWTSTVPEEPAPNQESASFARLPMRPEVLALHALQLTLENKNDWKTIVLEMNEAWRRKSNDGCEDEIQIDYSPRHLLDSFKKVFRAIDNSGEEFAKTYMDTLEAYRNWIDENIFFLRGEMETDKDEGNDSSGLKYAFREVLSQQNQKMLQLQSMLYVSSGERQEWILNAYKDHKSQDFNLFTTLRNHALAKVKGLKIEDLSYSSGMNRFAFWMLDYLLWEGYYENNSRGMRESVTSASAFNGLALTSEEQQAISNYMFRSNRSIEHFRPQNGAKGEWTDAKNGCRLLDSFGNLCMISSGFNSTQSDDSTNTKCGRIDDQVKARRLESIKMLIMRKLAGEKKEWTPKQALEHGGVMLKILGFGDESIKNWEAKLAIADVER